MNRIKYKTHTAKIKTVFGVPVLEFRITRSITKAHFKELMKVVTQYNATTKTGYVLKGKKDKFLEIAQRAEKSSDAVCKKSHAKSISDAIEKRALRASNTYASEDALEDLQDEVPAYRNASISVLRSAAKEMGYTY